MTSLLVTNDFPPKIGESSRTCSSCGDACRRARRRCSPRTTPATRAGTRCVASESCGQKSRSSFPRARSPTASTRSPRDRRRRDLPRPVAAARTTRAAAPRRAVRRRRARRRGDGAGTAARITWSRRARVAPRRGCRGGERVLGARSGARGAAPPTWRDRPARRRCRSVPADRRGRERRRAPSVRARRGAAARGRYEPPGAPEGLRRPHRRGCRAGETCNSRSPVEAATAGGSRRGLRSNVWGVERGFSVVCRMVRSRRSLRVRTCSRCHAATGGSVSKPRASASCSSKRPRRASLRLRDEAVARTKPSSTARLASSSTDTAPATFAARSPSSSPTPSSARMGNAARVRAVSDFSYDQLVTRLAPVAAGDLSGLRQLT